MAERYRVVVTDYLDDDLLPEREALQDLAEVEALRARSEDELRGRVDDADALLVYHHVTLGPATIERLRRCKVIVRCGVGYDNVDHEAAARRGIPVANVPDYGSEEVADSAIGLMLALVRGIVPANSLLRRGGMPWTHHCVAPLRRLRGRVFAVVGLGRIGTATALRARAFGMEVVYFDPYKPSGYDKALGISRAETLEELLRQAFVVSLHCPLTAETYHMIDDAALSWLPRGSYLVNTARGAVVDSAAVLHALESGQLAGAALDVLEHEPPADDDPLIVAWRDPAHPAYDRLILNPHSAFYSEESIREMRVKGAEAVRCALLGKPIPNVVNEPSRQ